MKKFVTFALLFGFVVAIASPAVAAPEKKKKKKDPEAVFAKMDKNGDKKVDIEEFVGKKKDEAADKAKKRFAKLDKDSDGGVTLEEFKAAGKKKKDK